MTKIPHLNCAEHEKTKAGNPQTNSCTESFNHTCLDKFYKAAFGKIVYDSLEDMPPDSDVLSAAATQKVRINAGRLYRLLTKALNSAFSMCMIPRRQSYRLSGKVPRRPAVNTSTDYHKSYV